METLAKILLIVLGISGLAFAALLAAFTWAIREMAKEEQEQIRQQMQDLSFCYDDHDVSGLIEED